MITVDLGRRIFDSNWLYEGFFRGDRTVYDGSYTKAHMLKFIRLYNKKSILMR